jgi:hypothetical protein
MRLDGALGAIVLLAACGDQALDPCLDSVSKPVLQIVAVRDQATGASGSALSLSNIVLDGIPVDTTVLRTNILHNVERTSTGLACTVPCIFGETPGTWAFDVRAPGFYPGHDQIFAAYTDVPGGCPDSYGQPTSHVVPLIEADSARVKFGLVLRNGTGLSDVVATVTFDDGSGPRSVARPWPSQPYVTRNTGTLKVRFAIEAPDTIGIGEVELPLMKDWIWGVSASISDRNPTQDSFCVEAKSFPLRRAIPNADSLYVSWGGSNLSVAGSC